MRVRALPVLAMLAMVCLLVPTSPASAAPPGERIVSSRYAPTLDPDVRLDVTQLRGAEDMFDIRTGLQPAAADVTEVELNGGEFVLRVGSTNNTMVFTGTGFTANTEYRINSIVGYPAITITGTFHDSPTQDRITFDVPAGARGIYAISTKEVSEPTWSLITFAQAYLGDGSYFPLAAPTRFLDSRVGIGGHSAPLEAGGTWRVQVAGVAGIPATATAVSVNVTAIGGDGGGFLSLYPAAGGRPDVSSVNFGGGRQVVPNHVIVPLGEGGALDLYSGAGDPVHALLDIDGYFSGENVAGGRLYWNTTPERVYDMRKAGVTIAPGSTFSVGLAQLVSAPLAAGDVADINVTITNQTGIGFASVYTAGTAVPNASTHNWVAPLQDTANRVAARVGTGGTISITNGSTGTIQVIIDSFGSWNESLGYRFTPLAPRRVYDTRSGSKLAVGESRVLESTPWVSPEPLLLVGNLTGDQPTSATFFQLWNGQIATPPEPSNLNLQAGETRANSFIVFNAFGSNTTNLRNSFGNTHAIIDIFGSMDD